MRFSLALITLTALAGLGSCAPSPSGKHGKRNTCTITGWWYVYQDVFDGGVGNPITMSGFQFNYVGGVPISNTTDNPLAATTLGQDDTHLAESIEWTPDFFLAFEGCQASYEGTDYTGYVNNNFGLPTGLGYTDSACSVDFQCEGNLPANN